MTRPLVESNKGLRLGNAIERKKVMQEAMKLGLKPKVSMDDRLGQMISFSDGHMHIVHNKTPTSLMENARNIGLAGKPGALARIQKAELKFKPEHYELLAHNANMHENSEGFKALKRLRKDPEALTQAFKPNEHVATMLDASSTSMKRTTAMMDIVHSAIKDPKQYPGLLAQAREGMHMHGSIPVQDIAKLNQTPYGRPVAHYLRATREASGELSLLKKRTGIANTDNWTTKTKTGPAVGDTDFAKMVRRSHDIHQRNLQLGEQIQKSKATARTVKIFGDTP